MSSTLLLYLYRKTLPVNFKRESDMKSLADTMKNVKVKAQYVLDNTELVLSQMKISSGTLMLINIAKRDGLKCHCCGDDKLYFTIDPNKGLVLVSSQLYKKKPSVMTKDHNVLKSLYGADTIDNQHLLCERCNSTRGNLFAEYHEFKSWYDEQLSFGRNPYKAIQNLKQNFCYVDFPKNIQSMQHIEHLTNNCSVFPPFIRKHLIQMYMKHGKFIRDPKAANNGYNYTNDLLLTRYSSKAWNDLMNTMVVMVIQKVHKFQIEKPNIDFSVYKNYNKKKMNATDFLNIIHHKIQGSVFELGKTAEAERREYILKENIAATKRQAEEMKQKVQVQQESVIIPSEPTFWQKIVNSFKSLFA